MGRLTITEDELNKVSSTDLLPVEEDGVVNGLPTKVKIKYLGEITSSKEQISKSSGGKMLVLTTSIWHPATHERLNILDHFAYSDKAVFKLKNLVTVLGLNPKALDSDDFLGRWVVVTIKHETFTGTKANEETGQFPTFINNKIAAYLREATAEEVMQQKSDIADAPPTTGTPLEQPKW